MFSGVSDPSENRETCAPGRAADWGSMTLTLRSAADAAEKETRSKNQAQSARITILLFTRKGLRWNGLRRSPGFASEDGGTAVSGPPCGRSLELSNIRKFLADGLPGKSP